MINLKVLMWGNEIGRLSWNPQKRTSYFTFNPNLKNRPDIAPLLHPKSRDIINFPINGYSDRIYQNLPPFIADSLPDSWGDTLFDNWAKASGIPARDITPLYKLMFIGKRGMGALEFEPAAEDLSYPSGIELGALYNLALRISHQRESIKLKADENPTLHSLLAAGTSAGGRQMKAIIALNSATGEIRSGQSDVPDDFNYYILKFEEDNYPSAEIEMAYYDLAKACGVEMMESSLFEVDGINHFLTRRFDRKDGDKVHIQTLAAINPDAKSYEALFDTCRALNLTQSEIRQLFIRMVFNIIMNNTDDHVKNFSFLLEKDGGWHLSPAYDMTFIFNKNFTSGDHLHCLSFAGRFGDFKLKDLTAFAKSQDISDAQDIIDEISSAANLFPKLAGRYKLPEDVIHIIWKTIKGNLRQIGKMEYVPSTSFIDSYGREIRDISLSINEKGIYRLSAYIDAKLRKRHIAHPTPLQLLTLHAIELNEFNTTQLSELIETMFPLD